MQCRREGEGERTNKSVFLVVCVSLIAARGTQKRREEEKRVSEYNYE